MSSVTLPGVFATLAPVLSSYGYLAVAGFVFLEDFGVPVPGETILVAAAVYAGAGQLNVVVVALVALAAAIAGDNVGFAIGRFGGRPLALHWGKYVLLTPRRLDAATGFFDRHGAKVVTVARFVEGLRQANGIVAGIAKMPWLRKFLPFNALGGVLWVAVWVTVGYFAGDSIDVLYRAFQRYEIYIGIGIAILVVAFIVHKVHQHHTKATTEYPTSPQEANHGQ